MENKPTKKQNKKEIKDGWGEWILNFERQAGRPVVVSVLVEEGNINFVSCLSKEYADGIDKGEDDSDEESNLQKITKSSLSSPLNQLPKVISEQQSSDYIG